MRSLFVKIFLWFWLATVLMIGTTLVLMSIIEPERPFPGQRHRVKKLAFDGQRAVAILEQEGQQSAEQYLSARQRGRGRPVILFNEKDEPVSVKEAPEKARELAARARESGMTESLDRGNSVMIARPLYGTEGRAYVIVGEVPRRPHRFPMWRFFNPRFLSLRLLVIFIVASLFCWWLAWHLTKPVRKLRTAAQRIASGDLGTRVMPELGSRKDEIADLGHDFDMMTERIESLLSAQKRLLRDVSHELRSPLARLNVALELARKRSGAEAFESLDRIAREAGRMNELIGQLRTLTLLESGTEHMEKTAIDLSSLVRRIAEDADFEAGSRNRSVTLVLNEPVVIDGYQELLGRAIENVVRNALRYTGEGTAVEISLKRQNISDTEGALITVRDHGPGVPPSALGELFQPFYRISSARDRQSGGMGIGLAITDRAIRVQGGTVKAENHPEGGLVVEIFLPLNRR